MMTCFVHNSLTKNDIFLSKQFVVSPIPGFLMEKDTLLPEPMNKRVKVLYKPMVARHESKPISTVKPIMAGHCTHV